MFWFVVTTKDLVCKLDLERFLWLEFLLPDLGQAPSDLSVLRLFGVFI